MIKRLVLKFCVWKSWLLCLVMGGNDNPKKNCCPTIACVIFGHGCQLTFSNAHNRRVGWVSWWEWNFGSLVIGFFGPFF